VLTRLARQFAEGWCRAALGDPRTQKRIPPIVRELIQPSRHFKVIYNGFFRGLYDVLGELLAAVQDKPRSTNNCWRWRFPAMGLLRLLSFEAAAIIRRRLSRHSTKRGAERTRCAEADIERDLGNGCTRVGQ
jgi:hypothetical protein